MDAGSANKRRRYDVTSSLIGWDHTQNDLCYTDDRCEWWFRVHFKNNCQMITLCNTFWAVYFDTLSHKIFQNVSSVNKVLFKGYYKGCSFNSRGYGWLCLNDGQVHTLIHLWVFHTCVICWLYHSEYVIFVSFVYNRPINLLWLLLNLKYVLLVIYTTTTTMMMITMMTMMKIVLKRWWWLWWWWWRWWWRRWRLLRPRHFADNIFKYIFLNENIWIFNENFLKYVPLGLIDNMACSIGSDNGLAPNRR